MITSWRSAVISCTAFTCYSQNEFNPLLLSAVLLLLHAKQSPWGFKKVGCVACQGCQRLFKTSHHTPDMQPFMFLIQSSATILVGLLIGFTLTINVSRYVVEKLKRHEGSQGAELTREYHRYKQKAFHAVFYAIGTLALAIVLSSIGFLSEMLFMEFVYIGTVIIFVAALLQIVLLAKYLGEMLLLAEPEVGDSRRAKRRGAQKQGEGLWVHWTSNRSRIITDILIVGVVGVLISATLGFVITSALKPRTDIVVSCLVREGVNANYSLTVEFKNNAEYAGRQFYSYLWGVKSWSWGSDYSVSEHCEAVRKLEVDVRDRFKIYCDMIPPLSKWGYTIDTDLEEEIIQSRELTVEYWGETTPYRKEPIRCEWIQ